MSAKGLIMAEEVTTSLRSPVGEHDHVQGPSAAAITLVEYGDYYQKRCADVQPWIKALQVQLGERMRLVFRHFPAAIQHSHAAEAAEAAGLQGQFWNMHRALLEHQSALGNGYLVEYAHGLGLDMERFLRDLADGVCAERVRSNRAGGTQSDVQDTPTFFVNGDRQPSSWKGDLTFMPNISPTRTTSASREGR
jgi:protein-disulfide isomerase